MDSKMPKQLNPGITSFPHCSEYFELKSAVLNGSQDPAANNTSVSLHSTQKLSDTMRPICGSNDSMKENSVGDAHARFYFDNTMEMLGAANPG